MKQVLLAGCALPVLWASAHASGLPQFMHGEWCLSDGFYVHGKCIPNSDGELTIHENSYHAHEKDCKFHKARWLKGDTYIVYAGCSGEGLSWIEKISFKLVGEKLHMDSISSSRRK
jgi:hypothetical protein